MVQGPYPHGRMEDGDPGGVESEELLGPERDVRPESQGQ
jgi:hypothetical protein